MAKEKPAHQTPPGFERVIREKGRVTYKPLLRARAVHLRFAAQTAAHPLFFADPGIEVANHVKRGNRYFFKTDLESAFDQVTAERLRAAFNHRSIPIGWLTPRQLFFHESGRGGLIQGAPNSPYLFETYCKYGGLDRALWKYCDQLGFYYSRYVDDILISSPRELGRRIGPSIRRIVAEFGFGLNDKKTKRVNVFHEPLHVLGYVIRGGRIDAEGTVIQKLFDPGRSDRSRHGLFRWRRHVRGLNRVKVRP